MRQQEISVGYDFQRGSAMEENDITAVFVGILDPWVVKNYTDIKGNEYSGPSMHLFQLNIVRSLYNQGINVQKIVSADTSSFLQNKQTILVRHRKDSLDDKVPVTFVPFINLKLLRKITLSFSVLLQLLLYGWNQRSQKNKLVILYNLTYPPCLPILLGAKLIGAKTLVHVSDIFVPGEWIPNSWRIKLDYNIHTKVIPKFDMLSVVNEHLITDFAPEFKGQDFKYTLVEGGISENTLHALCSIDVKIERHKETFDIVYAGALDAHTDGIYLLLEGFSLLEGQKYRLHIAGTGPCAAQVEQACKKDPRIIYHGLLPQGEVPNLYRKADLLVNTRRSHYRSYRYCFPSKVIEYMLSGRSVLLTNIGHTESEFGEFVFLLQDESPQGFANLVNEIRQTPPAIREAKARRAREYILKHKTWEVQGEKLARMIRNYFATNGKTSC
jgi:glycosyltransferase involved in cell wall biosynthesis